MLSAWTRPILVTPLAPSENHSLSQFHKYTEIWDCFCWKHLKYLLSVWDLIQSFWILSLEFLRLLFPCNSGTKTWLILHFHWKRTRGNFASSLQWDNWRQSWRISFVQPQFHIRYLYMSLDAFFTYLTLHLVKHICAIYWFLYFVIWHKP